MRLSVRREALDEPGHRNMAFSVTLVPAAGTDRGVLECLRRALSGMGLAAAIVEEVDLPPEAYDGGRGQYRAEALLAIARLRRGGRVVLVTEEDLYAGELNFVFGIADSPGKAAVVSLNRLRHAADGRLLCERAVKEVVHELGHTYGLRHCPDRACVMYFSNSLADTDRKGGGLCRRCRRALSRGPGRCGGPR